MAEKIDKYIDRATDLIIEFSKKEKQNLPSVDQAAEKFLQSKQDFKTIEAKFNVNSMDIVYTYLKSKYPDIAKSEKAEKLIKILKALADQTDKDSISKAKLVYSQLNLELQYLEAKIQAKYPEYQKKL